MSNNSYLQHKKKVVAYFDQHLGAAHSKRWSKCESYAWCNASNFCEIDPCQKTVLLSVPKDFCKSHLKLELAKGKMPFSVVIVVRNSTLNELTLQGKALLSNAL